MTEDGLLATTTITAVTVAASWLGLCALFRHLLFAPDGTSRSRHAPVDPPVRFQIVKHHSDAIYRAFEFYFKVTLAVLGGMAWIALSTKDVRSPTTNALLHSGAWLLWAAASVFASVIVMHQKSKMERWTFRFNWWEPILWIELPLISIMFIIAAGVDRHLLPHLAN